MWQNIIKNRISFLENENCVNLTMRGKFSNIYIFLFGTFRTINNFSLLFNSILPNIIDCSTCKSWKNTEKIYISLYKAETLQECRAKVIVLNTDADK